MPQAQNLRRNRRPQLTLRILLFALFDVAGMISLATGALWLARGQTLFFANFPGNIGEALAALACGLVLMIWAAAQILRELIVRPASNTQEGA